MIVKPEVYGARGDGVHDDTASLQRALDDAVDHTLELSSLYRTASPLIITNSNINMTGIGRTTSGIFTYDDHPLIDIITPNNGMYYNVLSNFRLENRCENRTGSSIGIRIRGGNTFRRYSFDNLHFRGTYHGIRISENNTHAAWGMIRDNLFDNYGINTHTTCISYWNDTCRMGQTLISGNDFIGRQGLMFRGIFGDSEIYGNNFDNGLYCIYIDVSGASNSSFTIVTNEVDVARQPIYIKGAKHFKVLGNSYLGLTYPGEDHVKLVDCSNYDIDIFRDVTGSGKYIKSGIDSGDGQIVVTRDNNSRDERAAHFVARAKSDKSKSLSLGYDLSDDEGWIQSVDWGNKATPLRLQPNGSAVVIGNAPIGGLERGALNIRVLYVNGRKIA